MFVTQDSQRQMERINRKVKEEKKQMSRQQIDFKGQISYMSLL